MITGMLQDDDFQLDEMLCEEDGGDLIGMGFLKLTPVKPSPLRGKQKSVVILDDGGFFENRPTYIK